MNPSDPWVVMTQIHDIVVGDHLAAASEGKIYVGAEIVRVAHLAAHVVLIWFEHEEHLEPHAYDGDHTLPILRTREYVIRDIVRHL